MVNQKSKITHDLQDRTVFTLKFNSASHQFVTSFMRPDPEQVWVRSDTAGMARSLMWAMSGKEATVFSMVYHKWPIVYVVLAYAMDHLNWATKGPAIILCVF